MKKKLFAMMMAAALTVSLTACGGGSSSDTSSDASTETTAEESTEATEDTGATEADLEHADAAEYAPEKNASDGGADGSIEYTQYTYVEYTIESAGATFVATVEKGADGYYIHNNFYGDEQVVQLEADGTTITYDKTGFMETDSPGIIKAAEEQGVWVNIE